MKIYQVCREYYDCPDSTIIKTFSSEEKAWVFIKEYKESPKWKDNHDNNECMVINEYEVEDIPLEQEPFINKSCVSSGICEHDKNKVLDKIRTELIQSIQNGTLKIESGNEELFRILDKYKAESEDKK